MPVRSFPATLFPLQGIAMYRQIVIALFSVLFALFMSLSSAQQDDIQGLSSFKRFADGYDGDEGGQSLPALVRFGKRGPLPALVRFGKRGGSMPALVRFGKRANSMPALVRFGKRSDSSLETPENDDYMNWARISKFRR